MRTGRRRSSSRGRLRYRALPSRVQFVSATDEFQCAPLVQRHVIGLVALDLIPRIPGACVVNVAAPVHIPGMHLDDPSADVPRFRVPTDMVADLEGLGRGRSVLDSTASIAPGGHGCSPYSWTWTS